MEKISLKYFLIVYVNMKYYNINYLLIHIYKGRAF